MKMNYLRAAAGSNERQEEISADTSQRHAGAAIERPVTVYVETERNRAVVETDIAITSRTEKCKQDTAWKKITRE